MAVMIDATFFIAVIVATIVSFVIGGIWYGPAFGKAWMAALGKTDADKEEMRKRAPKGFMAGLVGAFIASFVLGLLVQYTRDAKVAGFPTGITGGLVVGFLVWFGFLLTTGVSGAIFEGRSGKLLGINQGFVIISYLLMGAILGYWLWV
jgi:MFS family permease